MLRNEGDATDEVEVQSGVAAEVVTPEEALEEPDITAEAVIAEAVAEAEGTTSSSILAQGIEWLKHKTGLAEEEPEPEPEPEPELPAVVEVAIVKHGVPWRGKCARPSALPPLP